MKKYFLIASIIAIVTALMLLFGLSFASKILFQSEGSQILFKGLTNLVLSPVMFVCSLIFFKKYKIQKENGVVEHENGKDVDWWDIFGKIFFPITTISLIFLLLGILVWMARL